MIFPIKLRDSLMNKWKVETLPNFQDFVQNYQLYGAIRKYTWHFFVTSPKKAWQYLDVLQTH